MRGIYNSGKGKQVDKVGETYNPLKDNFIPTAVRFEFEPDNGATRPWVLPVVQDPWLMRGEILHDVEDADERLFSITSFYGRWGVGCDDLLVPWNKFQEGVIRLRLKSCCKRNTWGGGH